MTIASLPVLRWAPTPILFAGSLVTLIPLGLTGHSSAGGSHDLATNSLLIHLFAGALWAGGLLALLVHAMRGGDHADLAARRFSSVALWCFVAMACSGVVNALVRIRPGELVDTAYGRLVLAKVLALCVLGVLGWRQRRAGLTALRESPGARGPLIRLALIEAAVFGLTFGIAVGLGRTPPPPPTTIPSIPEVAIGYDFDGPPTLTRLLFDWRFDLFFGTAAIVLALVYLAGVRRLRRRGDAWPMGRTIAWLCGCVVLLVATSSGVGRYMPAMFSHAHGGPHAAVDADADPAGAGGAGDAGVACAADRWARRAARSAGVDLDCVAQQAVPVLDPSGRRDVLVHRRLLRAVLRRHFRCDRGQPRAHVLMNLHFLLSGYLFYWVVIGIDRRRGRFRRWPRSSWCSPHLPLHAFFGVVMMGTHTVFGEAFYRSLHLSWHTDLLGDQRLGGAIAWAAGELPLGVVVIALLIQWRRSDERTAKRLDRAADRDEDAELAAYNAMLAELSRRDARRSS